MVTKLIVKLTEIILELAMERDSESRQSVVITP